MRKKIKGRFAKSLRSWLQWHVSRCILFGDRIVEKFKQTSVRIVRFLCSECFIGFDGGKMQSFVHQNTHRLWCGKCVKKDARGEKTWDATPRVITPPKPHLVYSTPAIYVPPKRPLVEIDLVL